MEYILGASKRKRTKILVLIFSISVVLSCLNPNNSSIFHDRFNEEEQINDDSNDFKNLKINSNGPNARPLLVYQHATISNTFLPLSLPTNVSFTLSENWISKNVTIYYNGVSHQKDWVINGTFDAGVAPWKFFSSDLTTIYSKPWQPEYVEIEIQKNRPVSIGDYGYYEENFTIPENLGANTIATLSMNYKHTLEVGVAISNENISAFISIDVGGVQQNISLPFIDLVKNYWTEMSVTYDLSDISQQFPNNVTVRAGVYVHNNTFTSAKKHYLFLDDIQFQVWTSPNQRNLLVAKDVEFNTEYPYQNITFGKGKTFIDIERNRTVTSDVRFKISKNSTITEEFVVYNITIISEAVKVFNSTIGGQVGSLYLTQAGITWETVCSISIPYGYYNNWVEIKKPIDWNVTSVLNGYGVEKKSSCFGTEYGSDSLIIPEGQLSNGFWTVQASGQNYITKGSIFVWNGTSYNEQYRLSYGDTFRINATLNDTISLTNTQINCTIEYPNGTIFKELQKEPLSFNVDLGDFTVGDNMSVGTYQVRVIWTNNQSFLSRDKVGFSEFSFNVWHHTNLTAINSYVERVSGYPLLIRIKYMDSDFNKYIDFATVTYNSTFGTSGTMVYTGSGIYVIDVDSSELEIGDYYFSFNASKSYYENQSIRNLIHLKIINQPIALEVPHTVINAMANDYAICQVNVTGAISGILLPGKANITTDWINPYSVSDISTGIYQLNFSTYHIPSQGIIEVFTITIFVNLTNYGSTSGFVSLQVQPIATEVSLNQTFVNTLFNESFYLKVNYTDAGTGDQIIGAILNVSWDSSYVISPVVDGFIVYFSTNNLSIDVYTIFFQLSHPGYVTAFKSIFVNIGAKPSYIELYLNQEDKTTEKSITIQSNEDLNITVLYKDSLTNHFISGAIVELNGSAISRVIDENGTQYKTNISAGSLPIGIHFLTITIIKENYVFSPEIFSVIVNPITTVVSLNETIVNVLLNQGFYLKINYTIAGTGELITDAELNVTWGSTYTIFPVADGFIVYFSTSGLSIDIYTIFFQLNHPEYQTAFESIFVIIEENPTYIEVYLNQLDRTTEKTITIQWNEALNITILYKDSLTNDFISGAIVYMNGSGISRVLDENGQQYYTILSSGVMSVGIHFLTVSIEKDNYIFVSEILKIVVEQVVISVGTIDFENSLDVYAGSDQLIKINLTEQNSGNLIPNANITFSWRFDIGEFENLGDGTYQVQLHIPSSASGSYSVEFIISVEGGYYKTTESSFLIVVLQEQTPDNSYLIWVIAIVLLSVIGVFGALIARSYIFLPRKREKEQQFLDKIQVFKDLENIQGIMLIQKNSGMPFFTKNVSEFNFEENILISGFIQAITLFGEQSVIATSLKEKKKHLEIYSEHIIELNFKFFHLLICDYQCLRTLLILKDSSSEKLKNQLYLLTVEICSKFSEHIENYKGKAIDFEDDIEILLNKILFLFYNEPCKLNQGEVYIETLKKSRELESMESRVLNVIITLTKFSKEFSIDRIIQEMGEQNINLIYGGLQSLIENKMIIPAYFKNKQSNSSLDEFKNR
ncbi:MAG: hypothetical protein HWN81_06535 [Candidatus Lokiarchaeota archaeon]|nr:hypothetical protein [Candidatus Lokiarchaeota archaeon]